MKKLLCSHFLLIAFFISLKVAAQNPMTAYRKEGIWHYFDTEGKLMWQPYLDVAGFPSGWIDGYLHAAGLEIKTNGAADISLERRSSLYDKKGKIVFQAKTDKPYRIRTGFDKAGYIQVTDLEEESLLLCDKQGNIKYKSPSPYCQYLGDGVVAYIKSGEYTDGDRTYVIWDVKANKLLSEINCVGFIGNFDNSFVFTYNDKALCGLINRNGAVLLPNEYDSNLLELDEETIGVTGYVVLEDNKIKETESYILINKKGEKVLDLFTEVLAHKNGFFTCLSDAAEDYVSYVLGETNITEIDAKYGYGTEITEGGVIACKNAENIYFLLDKKQKVLAKIEGENTNVKALNNHFWISTEKENEYDIYNEKGQKTGKIQANAIGIPAYGHVPFMRDGLWGLAQESGKIVIEPRFAFSEEEVPPVENGYWNIRELTKDDKVRFDFYNFKGKLVLSTTAEADGWDYILPQETLRYYYKMY